MHDVTDQAVPGQGDDEYHAVEEVNDALEPARREDTVRAQEVVAADCIVLISQVPRLHVPQDLHGLVLVAGVHCDLP